ncbi:hypothetical protein DSBG_2075 [Desulfosporosinus sp. BG]|nr:hypothetical protein DSBG_2075 [Desulfosporosinus sp. BG]
MGVPFDADLSFGLATDKEAQRPEDLVSNKGTTSDCEEIWAREAILNYDAILVDGISLALLGGLIPNHSGRDKESPLILVCGSVTGENPGLRLKTFAFNLGQEGTCLLMDGREHTEKDVSEPILDWMLEEIRQVLRQEVKNFLELPPVPWGYSYAMTLTHDIDILSLKEMPVARTFLGYFYRSSVLNWKRWRTGKVETSEHFQAVWEMVRTWAAKVGLGQDVWQRALPKLLALEKRLGVRSSLYFMAFPEKPGILPEHLRKDKDKQEEKENEKAISSDRTQVKESAPANRASFYDVAEYKELLNSLEEGGWEAGVHGIDAWHDTQSAQAEYDRVATLTGQDEIGIRMHWLYFKSPNSFKVLEEGGFQYDSTFGFNEVVGFRAGTLQPYHPLNCQTLWELPLHIQDGALMGEEYFNLNREDAYHKAKPILDLAKRLGGVVSLLWHNQSFTAPRFWGEVYERLIAQGKTDGAWIAIPRDVLRWFNQRRKCEAVLSIEGTRWQISCTSISADLTDPIDSANLLDDSNLSGSSASRIPPVRIRLHLDPNRVRSASVPYVVGNGYIDFPAQSLVTLDVEGED